MAPAVAVAVQRIGVVKGAPAAAKGAVEAVGLKAVQEGVGAAQGAGEPGPPGRHLPEAHPSLIRGVAPRRVRLPLNRRAAPRVGVPRSGGVEGVEVEAEVGVSPPVKHRHRPPHGALVKGRRGQGALNPGPGLEPEHPLTMAARILPGKGNWSIICLFWMVFFFVTETQMR